MNLEFLNLDFFKKNENFISIWIYFFLIPHSIPNRLLFVQFKCSKNPIFSMIKETKKNWFPNA